MKIKLLLLPIFGFLLISGCDFTEDADRTQLVVESYLIAEEPLSTVRLSRTSDVNQLYSFTANAITGARVTVDLLGLDGVTVEQSYSFTENSSEPGVYRPANPENILPSRTYRLNVNAIGWSPSTSDSLVPGDFDLVEANADSVVYQGGEQLEVTVTPSAYPNRQSIFVFTTVSLDPTAENLTPFYRDVTDEDDLESIETNESPILNEGNFIFNPDNTVTIRIPWIAIAFYGPNQLIASALDDNLYDFLRSQGIQQGGSTLGPGEIPNAIDHVDGGIGIFGSLARSQTMVEILASANAQ